MKKELIQKLKDRARSKAKDKSMKIQRKHILALISEYELLKNMKFKIDFLQDEVKRLTVQNMILTKL